MIHVVVMKKDALQVIKDDLKRPIRGVPHPRVIAAPRRDDLDLHERLFKKVFVEDFLFMSPNARYFRMQNYYNFLDLGWVNNNPKLVKNPYQ